MQVKDVFLVRENGEDYKGQTGHILQARKGGGVEGSQCL